METDVSDEFVMYIKPNMAIIITYTTECERCLIYTTNQKLSIRQEVN